MENKPKNLKQFKALIRKYRSLTTKKIAKAWIGGDNVLPSYKTINKLTGAGKGHSCTLCQAIENLCDGCVWKTGKKAPMCMFGDNARTYAALFNARTPYKLYLAVRRRANHMEAHLTKLGITL